MVHTCARVVHKKPARIHHDLPRGIELQERAIHRTRRWPLEIHALAVIPAAVARTFELVLGRLPLGRATQMSATSENSELAVGFANDPHAIRHQVPLVDSDAEIGRKAGSEHGIGFVQRARKEKS